MAVYTIGEEFIGIVFPFEIHLSWKLLEIIIKRLSMFWNWFFGMIENSKEKRRFILCDICGAVRTYENQCEFLRFYASLAPRALA